MWSPRRRGMKEEIKNLLPIRWKGELLGKGELTPKWLPGAQLQKTKMRKTEDGRKCGGGNTDPRLKSQSRLSAQIDCGKVRIEDLITTAHHSHLKEKHYLFQGGQ